MLNCFVYYAGEQVYAVISHVVDALLAAEGKLNELDNLAGDGDCGSTLSRGASGTQYSAHIAFLNFVIIRSSSWMARVVFSLIADKCRVEDL